VAIYSTGITVSFNGNTFTEVTGLSWNFGGGQSEARSAVWRANPGQISVQLIGGASTSLYGKRGTMTITGGGVNLLCVAVCTNVDVQAQLNGVTQYTYEFDILDN
jgi:hypothetical protein